MAAFNASVTFANASRRPLRGAARKASTIVIMCTSVFIFLLLATVSQRDLGGLGMETARYAYAFADNYVICSKGGCRPVPLSAFFGQSQNVSQCGRVPPSGTLLA